MDDLGEDEDVIIEGSELHRALVNMGYTDFESTPANKNDLRKKSFGRNYKWLETICNFFKSWSFNGFVCNTRKIHCLSSKQLAIILRAEGLLDDHTVSVQSMLEKNSQSSWNKFVEWSNFVAASIIFGAGYFLKKRQKTLAMFVATSLIAMTVFRKYEEFQSAKALSNLVMVQNDLYRSYKKSLGILRKVYRIKIDEKKPQSKFSKLEIDRLKYLQPITEYLLKSMENVSRMYYKASMMIIELLPRNSLPNDTVTHFEVDEFTIDGEITYEKLRHLYYVYILVQSDTMQLLAIAYDADTWINDGEIPNSLLRRIMLKLCHLLTQDRNKITEAFVDYESCQRIRIERKLRFASTSKWRDLYLNLDLLSRKLQIAYDDIVSILEEIENRKDEEIEDTLVVDMTERIQDIYGKIDKARNFAEFNNLLMTILQRSRHVANNPISEISDLSPEIECNDRTILRDSEPMIMDEVFEEYIKEEYLKPLYEESDDATIASAKLDKLLVKNFMSELKEALVEKCKSMSERETKALLRKYRETNESPTSEENNSSEIPSISNREKSIIPRPPPLSGFGEKIKESRGIVTHEQKKGCRGPIPLPRARSLVRNIGNNSNDIENNLNSISNELNVPLPPPLPFEFSKNESCENAERFSIDLPKFPVRKVPAFVTFAEEFIGSGENSEEESENIDHDQNEFLENVTDQ